MQVTPRKISELIHPDYNPRQIKERDFDQLKRSLQVFGAVDIGGVDKNDTEKKVCPNCGFEIK